MRGDGELRDVLNEVRATLDARTAGIVVTPPPFEAILARAQGQPPAPPTGAPLPLPTAAVGPGGMAAAGSGVGTAPSLSSPASQSPGRGVQSIASSPATSSPSSATDVVRSSARAPRRLLKRLLTLGVGGVVATASVIGFLVVTSDDPCVGAADAGGAECRDLESDAQSLLDALTDNDQLEAANFADKQSCLDRIPDAVEALDEDPSRASISSVTSARGFGTVVVNVTVEGVPVPFPTRWAYSGGTWKLQTCFALWLLT